MTATTFTDSYYTHSLTCNIMAKTTMYLWKVEGNYMYDSYTIY